MGRIQLIAIAVSLGFLFYISRLIVKGKLREEYAFVWIFCTAILIVFSLWREGLDVVSRFLGIYDPPNMVFTGAIFAILIYLLHLSITVSMLTRQNKTLAQEIALMRQEKETKEKETKEKESEPNK
jgi:hypothetical protein